MPCPLGFRIVLVFQTVLGLGLLRMRYTLVTGPELFVFLKTTTHHFIGVSKSLGGANSITGSDFYMYINICVILHVIIVGGVVQQVSARSFRTEEGRAGIAGRGSLRDKGVGDGKRKRRSEYQLTRHGSLINTRLKAREPLNILHLFLRVLLHCRVCNTGE